MRKNKEKPNAEAIIYLQSLLLLCFGAAGWMASNTITSAFNAFKDNNNAVVFITEDAVVTDNGNISTDDAVGVISNFELVCAIALICSAGIALATYIRWKRS